MASIVVDASVCLKWFLADEADRPSALALRERIVIGETQPVAPSHLPLEIAAGLIRAVRPGRPMEESVLPALAALAQLELEFVDIALVTSEAARIAVELGTTPHDAAYVAVAEHAGAPLITADEALHTLASAAGHNVVLLSELPAA